MLGRADLVRFNEKAYRDGYLQAKVRGMIAYQIQALREKTDLSQTEFAKQIGKTQSVVSRLENTEYGKVTIQTLLDIACALDVALVVKFASYPDFLFQTRDASVAALQPDTIFETLSQQPAQFERPTKLPLGKAAATGNAVGQNYSPRLAINDNALPLLARASGELRAQA